MLKNNACRENTTCYGRHDIMQIQYWLGNFTIYLV